MRSSLKTPLPLMLIPKAALRLCCLLSLLVFEAELRIDGCLAADSLVEGESDEKRSGLKVVQDKFAKSCSRSRVPLFNSLLGCALDVRFFFLGVVLGPVLAYSMRHSRMEAWKLTKASILKLLSAATA